MLESSGGKTKRTFQFLFIFLCSHVNCNTCITVAAIGNNVCRFQWKTTRGKTVKHSSVWKKEMHLYDSLLKSIKRGVSLWSDRLNPMKTTDWLQERKQTSLFLVLRSCSLSYFVRHSLHLVRFCFPLRHQDCSFIRKSD